MRTAAWMLFALATALAPSSAAEPGRIVATVEFQPEAMNLKAGEVAVGKVKLVSTLECAYPVGGSEGGFEPRPLSVSASKRLGGGGESAEYWRVEGLESRQVPWTRVGLSSFAIDATWHFSVVAREPAPSDQHENITLDLLGGGGGLDCVPGGPTWGEMTQHPLRLTVQSAPPDSKSMTPEATPYPAVGLVLLVAVLSLLRRRL